MSDTRPTQTDVQKATSEDLKFVLDWLKCEYEDDDGEGFWCNRNVISRALDSDELWVIRRNGQAVAFQVGTYSADIVSVRKDYRNCGLGRALFEASLERARKDDVNVLHGQCAPETSLGFWEKMGFERYQDRHQPDYVMVRMVIPRKFELPTDIPRANVTITFYPEESQYYGRSDVPPIVQHFVTGAQLADGSVALDRRVIGLSDDEPRGKDLAIKIEVDGKQRCFCKAKYEEAKNMGVMDDLYGGAFFIDRILPNSGGD